MFASLLALVLLAQDGGALALTDAVYVDLASGRCMALTDGKYRPTAAEYCCAMYRPVLPGVPPGPLPNWLGANCKRAGS